MDTKIIQCSVCNEEFSSRNKLFAHIAKVHDEKSSETASNSSKPPAKKTKIDSALLEDQIKTIEEDDEYRIICKPQGLATMGAKGATLVSSKRMLLPNAIELNLSYKKAVPCHRLDRDTGGLVVCSKNFQSQVAISNCFRNKFVYKKYLAVVAGRLEPSKGYITAPISGKAAATRYSVIHYTNSKQHGCISTVELFPVTGRKHQLRRHLQSVGHSILGDRRYSYAVSWPPEQFPYMFLFAVGIELPHPSEIDKVLVLAGKTITKEEISYNSDDENDDDDDNDEKDSNENILPVPELNSNSGVNVGYGCVREDYIANNIKMIKVEIPEPDYYLAYRHYCESTFVSSE